MPFVVTKIECSQSETQQAGLSAALKEAQAQPLATMDSSGRGAFLQLAKREGGQKLVAQSIDGGFDWISETASDSVTLLVLLVSSCMHMSPQYTDDRWQCANYQRLLLD